MTSIPRQGTTDSATRNTLERRIGLFTAASVVVANVIGSGIFTTSGFLARDLANPGAILLVWVVGGVLALAGAMSYSELGAAIPEAGGEYVYLREAYGPLAGFLAGWISFFVGFSGAIAATALAFAAYLNHFIPGVAPPHPSGIAIAVALVWVLAAVHVAGVGPGGLVQRLLTIAKVIAIALLLAAGFTAGAGDMSHFRSGGAAQWSNFAVSLVFVMFAYSGWNAAAYLAGEIRDPARNLSWALLGGTLLVTALYLLLNLFYIYALPVSEMAGVPEIAQKASIAAFGHAATSVVTGIVILAFVGSISAMVLAGPRVYYAMARDGVFPASIAAVHPRFRTPARAIILQAIWSTLLILFAGILEKLLVYVGFTLILSAAMAVGAVFVLRVKRPEMPRPYRVPGYPIVPALFILASIWMGIFTLRGRPKESALGLLTVAAGVPFYLVFRSRRP